MVGSAQAATELPEVPFNLRRRFGLALSFSAVGFSLYAAAQVVNFYREPWLGIEPGYAPHNFAFNLSFFIPMILLSTLLVLFALFLYVRSLLALRRRGQVARWRELAVILPGAPVLMFDFFWVRFVIQLAG